MPVVSALQAFLFYPPVTQLSGWHPRGSLIVFDLPNNNKLSLEIIDSDIAMIDLVIKALDGNTIIKMSKNYIEYKLKEGIDIRRVRPH